MADLKTTLKRLEDAIWRYEKVADTLLYLTTVDERQSTLAETLAHLKASIEILNDEKLTAYYERLMDPKRTDMKYGQVLKTDYGRFMTRLVNLAEELTIEANQSDVELREALNLDVSKGIWGPKDWAPPADIL